MYHLSATIPLHDIRSTRANFYPETHFVFGITSIDLMDELNFLEIRFFFSPRDF
jgi:hypothetical protein